MVDVGTMEIKGTIETSGIDNGLMRIEGSLKQVDIRAKQMQGSFEGVKTSSIAVGNVFADLAIKGLTAITGLAAKSPILGATFAKMEIGMLKVSNTLGRQLKPAFDEIANNLIPSLNQAFVDLGPTIEIISGKAVKSIDFVADAVKFGAKSISQFEKLLSGEDPTEIEGGIIPSKTETAGSKFEHYAESETAFEKYMSYSDKYPQGGKPTITDQLVGIKDFFGLLLNVGVDTYQWLSEKEGNLETVQGKAP